MLKLVSKRIFAYSQRNLLIRKEKLLFIVEKCGRQYLKEVIQVSVRQTTLHTPPHWYDVLRKVECDFYGILDRNA